MNRASHWTCAALAAVFAGSLARAQTTERVSVATGGAQGNSYSQYVSSMSADGRFVAFASNSSNLVADDTNGCADVFVHGLRDGTTELVSVATGGGQGNGDSANSGGVGVSISADGRFVAFDSVATNLVAGDTNGWTDVFVHDRRRGTTERVSTATGGTQASLNCVSPSISADGRFVTFTSIASNLVAGDTNGSVDVFLHDRRSGTTERVSVATGGAEGNDSSGDANAAPISADGRFVAFYSYASNLVADDTNGAADIFVRDRWSGTTERVSTATGGTQGNFNSWAASISSDGRFVAFASGASNLVADDTNGSWDTFVHDRQGGTTERVSVGTDGSQGNANSLDPSISGDGRFVAFWSGASNLVNGDTNFADDVFVHDRRSGTTERVSVATGGAQSSSQSESEHPSISADGRSVALWSTAANLVAADTNAEPDVFVHDLH